MNPTSLMAWDKIPEIYLKKNDPSPYDGVLVPELNYQAYKFYEKYQPKLLDTIEGSDVPIMCPEKDSFVSGVMIFGVGFSVASLMFLFLPKK